MNDIPEIKTEELKEKSAQFRAGDKLLLTGTVYTARDAAHKRFAALLGMAFRTENRGSHFAFSLSVPMKK